MPVEIDAASHALFLDFDGTLAPIVDRPGDARMSAATREAINRLRMMTGDAVAILSGRALDDLRQRMEPLDCAASGSHGLEIRTADGALLTGATGPDLLAETHARIAAFAADHDLMVENKPGAVTLHYRSHPDLAPQCKTLIDDLAKAAKGLRALHGHMVSEVALSTVNKGTALERFMSLPPFRGRRPIMAGDDQTDEDAIRAAQSIGGLGIRIGPGPTLAQYQLPGIESFLDWLGMVARSGRT